VAWAHLHRRAGIWSRIACFVGALLLVAPPARAWIEQVVSGHETRVTLDRDGWLEARHQLTLTLRGGPLKSLEIEGVGEDIELLSDAKVTRLKNASGPGIPLRLSLSEGGALRIEVLGVDGLRSGTYRFDFGYRLDAHKRKLLETGADRATLTWVGPRLSGGVDSAKVVISVPHADRPPALPSRPERAARGVLLGQVLVGSAADEIELLRTHVAVGEPAVWQVEFDHALAGHRAEDPLKPPAPGQPSGAARRRGPSLLFVGIALAVAALVLLLVVQKERAVRTLALGTDARARPLVPGPAWLRAALSAALAGGFVALALSYRVGGAMAAGVVLALLNVHFPPVRRSSPRGPGTWIALDAAARLRPRWSALVRVFDPSTLLGFATALSLLALGSVLAYLRMSHDSLQALLCLALVLLLSPLFLTGRLSDFPRSPAEQALPWFRLLMQTKLAHVRALELWGRKTEREQGLGQVDEVRIRIVLESPPLGLRALEVAFEEGPGSYVSPCLLLRVVEDSPTCERLPKEIAWSRGRRSEEKTAILHPLAPTGAQLLRLLRSLLAHLRSTDASRPAASRRAPADVPSRARLEPASPAGIV